MNVFWIKAHVLAKHLLSGQVSQFNAFGNAVADLLAKAGARINEATFAAKASVDFIEARAHLIRTRLIAIQKCALIRLQLTEVPSAVAVLAVLMLQGSAGRCKLLFVITFKLLRDVRMERSNLLAMLRTRLLNLPALMFARGVARQFPA